MGDKAKEAEDRARAEAVLRKLIEVDPSNLSAYSTLGQLLYAQGRLEDAKKDFELAIQRDPKAVWARTFVGIILEMQNRTAEAQKQYEQAIQIDPKSPVAANNLAWIYAEQNVNLEVALQLAETAKSRLPDVAQVDDTLGWVYYKKGLFTLAITSFKHSIELDPKSAGSHYRLGLAYAKVPDKANARASIEKALAIGGSGFKDAAEAKKVLATLG
jgi:Tfp pilus assembly protein PilF